MTGPPALSAEQVAKSRRVVLTRDVTMAECDWLDRDYQAGERLWTFHGYTYGVVVEDGIALSEARDQYPFDEFPRDAVRVAS